MKAKGIVTLEVNGKVVHRQRMKSFIGNFISMLCGPHGGSATIQDVTNTPSGAYWGALNPGFGGYLNSYVGVYPSVGVDSVGIVVGIGSTPVSLNDYKLDSKVVTGNGPGQLAYQDQLAGVTSVVSQVTTTRITRSFINNSGSDIVIAEVGIMGDNTSGVCYLMVRDVIGSPVTVANGATLNVYIDLQVTA